MDNRLMISLPAGVSTKDAESIELALKAIDSVVDAGATGTRGVDPASIMVWVEVAGGVLGVVSTAVLIIQKIRAMIRSKGIAGATIKLADGTEISVDHATAEEIERLLREVGRK